MFLGNTLIKSLLIMIKIGLDFLILWNLLISIMISLLGSMIPGVLISNKLLMFSKLLIPTMMVK